jgi:hypothetical protein
MRDDELERLLSGEQAIIPSSGFAASVMDAVRREEAVPPPIPFPWKRALPGLCAMGLVLVSVVVISIILWLRGIAVQPLPARLTSELALMAENWKAVGASWMILALVLSYFSVKLSMRLASGKT